MIASLLLSLNNWNATKSERQKLQHSLLALTALIILVSGIISLFNARVGHDVVWFALFSLAVFVTNAVIWNLIQSSLIAKLSTRPKRR